MNKIPTLTIITITYNDYKGLYRTFLSLERILDKNIQWIIKDGGSKKKVKVKIDKFINNIYKEDKKLKKKITYYSSIDNGIYDAMNFGLNLACGKWVIFMNGGDEFYSSLSVLDFLENNGEREYKIILGSTYILDNDKKYINKSRSIKECEGINGYRMAAMHQSQIFHKDIYRQIRFRERFKISGDHAYFWDSVMKIKDKKNIFLYSNVISNFYNDGVSSNKAIRSLFEVFISMIRIQKIPYPIAILASLKRLIAIVYFYLRSRI